MILGPFDRLKHIRFALRSIPSKVIITILVSACAAVAAQGKTALDFLNLPVGADATALGQGGYAAIVGPEAVFGNPSLLGRTAFFVAHEELLFDTQSEALAASIEIGRRYALGLGALFFSPGSITGYSPDNLRTGQVDAGDRAFRLAISRTGRISVGLSASYYSQRLDSQTGSGFGLGGAVSGETRLGRFAISADNLGPDFRIGTSSDPLPGRVSFSGWVPLFGAPADISFDLSYRYGIGPTGAAGLQYRPLRGFEVRGGTSSVAPLAFGFRFTMGSVALDYAFVPPGDFGDRHIFSFVLTK